MVYESWTGSWYIWMDDAPRMRMDISEEPAMFHMDITGRSSRSGCTACPSSLTHSNTLGNGGSKGT